MDQDGTMALKVHRAGILSTLQDLGRYGYQRFGVPVGGVMDEYSHRLANLLVGNAELEATLEMTLAGPRLEFTQDTLMGICGGDFAPTLRGSKRAGGATGTAAQRMCAGLRHLPPGLSRLPGGGREVSRCRSSWAARAPTCAAGSAVSRDARFAVAI